MNMPSNNNRAYHRPFNKVKSSSSERIGRTLLDLIRTRDKVSSSSSQSTANQQLDDDEQEQEITQLDIQITLLLNKLSNTISSSNGGLFNSDINRAQSFYECASNRSSSTATGQNENGRDISGGGGKKRKRNKGGSSNNNTSNSNSSGLSAISYGIHLDSHSNTNSQQSIGSTSGDSKGGDSLDEGLVLTSICKLLGVTIGRKKKQQQQTDEVSQSQSNITATGIQQQSHRYSYNLICGSLNVLLSICNHAKDYDNSSSSANAFTTDNGVTMSCASIELDMISSIGSYLVDGLCDNILYLYYSSSAASSATSSLEGLAGRFKVCASLVSLLNIKLSKCTKSIANLYDSTWLVLNNLTTLSTSTATEKDISNVKKAGTVLLSTLVLVGNSDGMPPSKIWSQSVVNGITLLKWAVNDFFPIVDNKDQGNRQQSSLWKEHEKWLSIAKEVPSSTTSNKDEESSLDLSKDDPTDTHRSQSLQHRIQVLSCYIHSLLTMDGYPVQQNHMIGINLPLDALLDISEILLSFPLAAEAKHRSTKSRLRSIPIKNGLLSPNSAMEISPSIKLCGHLLLDVTVESTRGAGILSKARRIVGMSVSSLQSSCSLSLVSAVDGNRRGGSTSSNASDRVSKIGIHLRESIPLRIKSIYTFHCVSISLGSGVMSSTGTVKSMCRALVLLGGCLLEQVSGSGDELSGGGDWGSLGERAKLV